jgi:catechol 2,3-dioxygenase-like lactoylglutathione lyase family enzyme
MMTFEGVQVVSVPVSDQDNARAFYTDTLGFELRAENTFGEGARWMEVAPRGSATSLTLVTWFAAMPPGSLQGLVFAVDDVRATYEELLAKGDARGATSGVPRSRWQRIRDRRPVGGERGRYSRSTFLSWLPPGEVRRVGLPRTRSNTGPVRRAGRVDRG